MFAGLRECIKACQACLPPRLRGQLFAGTTTGVQKDISAKLNEARQAKWKELCDTPDKLLHYTALQGKHAGVILSTFPERDKRLRLFNDEFMMELRLRLGVRLEERKCQCQVADADAWEHLLRCTDPSTRATRIMRHTNVGHMVERVVTGRVQSKTHEPTEPLLIKMGFTRKNGTLSAADTQDATGHALRGDSAFVLAPGNGHGQRSIVVDYLIPHPFASSVKPSAANIKDVKPGFACVAGERSKMKKYQDKYTFPADTFRPFVVDSFGGWGHSALQVMNDIFVKTAKKEKMAEADMANRKQELKDCWRAIQVVSFTRARGNFLSALSMHATGGQCKDERIMGRAKQSRNSRAGAAAEKRKMKQAQEEAQRKQTDTQTAKDTQHKSPKPTGQPPQSAPLVLAATATSTPTINPSATSQHKGRMTATPAHPQQRTSSTTSRSAQAATPVSSSSPITRSSATAGELSARHTGRSRAGAPLRIMPQPLDKGTMAR